MKIKVMQEDIDVGVCGDGSHCPIAHALSVAGFTGVHVGYNEVVFLTSINSPSSSSLLPRSVRAFIKRFDANKPVEPFNFILSI